jgi:hypothetical protein
LNWDLWLGAASMRPFSSYYVPYNWRGFWDFGTGQVGNWATHTAGPVHTALMLGAPSSIECVSQVTPSKFTFPVRGVVRLDFPARGAMPAVKVFFHDSTRAGDPEAFHVPGMENETILPPVNNLSEKGRPMGRGAAGTAAAPPAGGRGGGGRAPAAAGAPRQGAGGPGVRVFGEPNGPSQHGVLTGNGSVFIGTKGVMATSSRGEGVWLLPAARWAEYKLPPQLLTRSPGHMLDWVRACKGGDASCADFSVTAPYAEWLSLISIAYRVPGKLDWDSKALRFTNNAEANKYVRPAMRKGWEIKL